MRPSDPPIPPELQQRLAALASDLANAEQELRAVLEALPPTIRAEKQIISGALQEALEKLAVAKERLGGKPVTR